MLEIDVLGCGSSLGVPIISCKCQVCKSGSIYNKRLRSSIIISKNSTKILVDFGFNIKEQLLNLAIDSLDAAILTHNHADHISGIDELRAFFYIGGKSLEVFIERSIAQEVLARYDYLFSKNQLKMNMVDEFDEIKIGDIKLQLFPQIHGKIKSLGIKIDDFIYSCDVSSIMLESEKYLKNLKVWILDCIDYSSTPNHSGLHQVLEWDKKYQPQKIYLTNMSHNIDYHKIITELPYHIQPLHDNFKIKL